ncbi:MULTISPECIES: M14 family zinc carboxypeptidase [unclassified Bacillus (in: firmicutes)]|uniref:M14 family zinc carboxypeptidase n=1 Tax=unclassified Bacillus (in: firmicutes) TaxID=185979 RepID=UPI0008E4018C|nr:MULTISPECIES: M14 family zinc carboxypeptidase [unclassified Bacillus (in: firmicutes)]SFA80828.1 g-D-glutamyl-meso-diaminopimelate peptidase [Bacillus sp. UNCCL13]SFQ70971.1 g-D-glutamyl-meso-diaminopimelate peptidase [Bacillus sp. cl95]
MKKRLLLMICLLSFYSNIAYASPVVKTDNLYTYEEMLRDVSDLDRKYKEIITVNTIGHSHFNRKIMAIKLGKGQNNILINGSHHGREWMTTMLIMKMIETYAEAYANNNVIGKYKTDIFNDFSIWFVPMVNPDGVTLQQFGPNQFPIFHQKSLLHMNNDSHDFKGWKANGWGVDLNRQYPAGWNELKGESQRNYQFYKGHKPLQAIEVQAISHFTKRIKPALAISYHTAGREIFWNYQNGEWLVRDRKIAAKVAQLTGYKLNIPPKKATGGGFTDWFITTFHKPAMTIEISFLVGERNPPLSVFSEEWVRNCEVGIMLAHEIKTMYIKK